MGRYMTIFDNYILQAVESSTVKAYVSGVIVTLSEFFGADWWIVESLFIFIFIDFILGASYALKTRHKLDGMKLHDGLVKMLVYSIFIILAWYLDELTTYILHIDIPVLAFMAGYQALTEIKSISRHLTRLGCKMPAIFTKVTSLAENRLDSKLDSAFDNSSVSSMESEEDIRPIRRHRSSGTHSN